jgi:excisionase family DNA binding protein
MRIQEAARRLGISADWLKELERRGVVIPVPRDLHGHRRFSEEDVERLRQRLFPSQETTGAGEAK